MTVVFCPAGAYADSMSLPDPARTMTLAGLAADPDAVRRDLEAGGAILVLTDDEQHYLGVLTLDPAVRGDAELAEAIAAGRVPPLPELLKE